jgi:caffeoyl-CoA O-methyltransferase
MTMITAGLEQYILDHTSPEDRLLEELNRATRTGTSDPQMMAGLLQGRILEMISRMISPKRILEIGTFTGYSAICLARGLAEGGRLFTIERNDEITGFAGNYIRKSGMGDRITILAGDAREIIPQLQEVFDLVYLDAEKDEYLDYYEAVLPKLRQGGFLLADNVLWGGKVLEKPAPGDHSTMGILAFNDAIRKDTRVEQVILPVRDGLMLARKI